MSRCLTPYTVRNKGPSYAVGDRSSPGNMVAVPCGKCPICQKKRVDQWIFRITQEEKQHSKSRFVTLTYEDNNLPVNQYGEMVLNKKDLQNYFKKLRKTTLDPIKYYACGEYGSKTQRPHYHAIVFGASDENLVKKWDFGLTHIGDVTKASIAYCCKYISKAVRKFDTKPDEFSVMSKKMGLNYLTPQMVKWHEEGLKNYVEVENGRKMALPRYFKQKIFTEAELETIAQKNESLSLELFQKDLAKYGSLEELNRVDFFRVKQIINNFNKLQNEKRNKI